MHIKQAVCGVLFDSSRKQVLLIKRRDIPVWVLPGGGLEPNETAEEAILREMKEETGYEVRILRKVAAYESVNRFTQPTHLFECSIVSGKPSTGQETKEVQFFPLDHLPKYLAPPYKGWIADAAAQLPHLIIKKIEGVSYWVFIKLLILHPICVIRYLLTKIGVHLNTPHRDQD